MSHQLSAISYQLLLACDLNLLNQQTYEQLHEGVTEVKRMLYSFIATLKADR